MFIDKITIGQVIDRLSDYDMILVGEVNRINEIKVKEIRDLTLDDLHFISMVRAKYRQHLDGRTTETQRRQTGSNATASGGVQRASQE